MVDDVDLGGIHVHADHRVSFFCEAGRGHAADITNPEYAKLHPESSLKKSESLATKKHTMHKSFVFQCGFLINPNIKLEPHVKCIVAKTIGISKNRPMPPARFVAIVKLKNRAHNR